MKHCKVEFDDDVYEVIREAAYRSRLPIKRWVQRVAAEGAAERTGLPLPCVQAAATLGPEGKRTGSQEGLW